MSIQSLRERVESKLLEQVQQHYTALQNLRFHQGGQLAEGPMVPPVSVESIAMQTLEANAAIRALSLAHEILNDEFKRLTSPKKEEKDGARDGEGEEPIYG